MDQDKVARIYSDLRRESMVSVCGGLQKVLRGGPSQRHLIHLCPPTGHGQHSHHGAPHRVHDPHGRGPRQDAPEGLRAGGRRQHGHQGDAGELHRHAEVQRHEEHEEGRWRRRRRLGL